MTLGTKTNRPNIEKLAVAEPTAAHAIPDYAPSGLERRCSQALLTVLPQLRQIVNRDREGEGLPITVQQYSVLKILAERKRLISELADMLKVSRPTMSRIIDGLEGRRRSTDPGASDESRRPRLVERVASQDDHRLVYVHITEDGMAMLRHYHIQAEDSILAVLSHLEPEELPAMLHSFERLAQVLK